MRLNSEDPPKSLVAYSLLPGSVTVASGPEVPGIAPMLFELSQSGIAGLVTTGPSAWTSVTALGLSKTNHAWCEDRGGTCNNKESRVTLARSHSSLHIAVISLLPKNIALKVAFWIVRRHEWRRIYHGESRMDKVFWRGNDCWAAPLTLT